MPETDRFSPRRGIIAPALFGLVRVVRQRWLPMKRGALHVLTLGRMTRGDRIVSNALLHNTTCS
jgi:hypothetical protein